MSISERSLPTWKVLSPTSVSSFLVIKRIAARCSNTWWFGGWLNSSMLEILTWIFGAWAARYLGNYFRGIVKRSIEKNNFAGCSMSRGEDVKWNEIKWILLVIWKSRRLGPLIFIHYPQVGLCPRFSSAALLPVCLIRWMCERKARLDALRRTRRENELAKIRRH